MMRETSGTEFISIFLVMRMRRGGYSLLNSTTSKHPSSCFHENASHLVKRMEESKVKRV